MSDRIEPKLTKWPFFLGDAVLVASAGYIFAHASRPAQGWELAATATCLIAGAFLAAWPFVLEHRALVKLLEAGTLATTLPRIGQLEAISGQISSATGHWQNIQEEAEKVNAAAKNIAGQMAAELKNFSEFMERANETEKANLRLEVEKLRRAEADWLQVLVRVLDHVFAVYVGALRSDQPALIEQLGSFQNACRDAARRVGLVPFVPAPEETFNPDRHQAVEAATQPPAGTAITEIVATGYTFQGRLLRPALVRVAATTPAPTPPA